MEIKVLGPGCANCHAMEELAKKAVTGTWGGGEDRKDLGDPGDHEIYYVNAGSCGKREAQTFRKTAAGSGEGENIHKGRGLTMQDLANIFKALSDDDKTQGDQTP